MRRGAIIGWSVFATLLTLGVIATIIAVDVGNKFASEYTSAHVIEMVEVYVIKNNGEWPSSWQELVNAQPDPTYKVDYLRAQTIVDFSITSTEILNDPELIYRSISPVRGNFGFYPQSQQDFERLLQAIRDAHSTKTLDAAKPSSRDTLP